MFTGIIEETGQVEEFAPAAAGWRLRLTARRVTQDLAAGDSVAVNGCCLTVAEFTPGRMAFDMLEETRRLTNLADLRPGMPVNLESSLRLGGKLGGHFVSGHIDGTGTVDVFEPRGTDYFLAVSGPKGCGRYLVGKGSIAIDGISLTLAEVTGDRFAVWIIPHTRQVTNLMTRRAGDRVNLEFDLLGKYVEKLMPGRLPESERR